MNGQCQAIKFLYRNGKTASAIFRLLKPKVSRSGVFKIIKRFKETGSFLPRVRNTPPRPIRTPTLIKIIKNKIKKNPKRTVIPEETLQATCAQVIQRLRRVIAGKGSFIEF